MRHDQLGVGRQPEVRARAAMRSSSSSGWNRSVSTPGGTTVIGSVAPGGPLGLAGRRTPPPTTTWRARRSTWPSACLRARQPAGHGDLGAVEHDVVGQVERRADQPERDGRVEHDEVGAELGGQLVDAAHHRRVRQQHRLADPLDAVRLLGVERRGARGTGW